ncbi:MAG: hypothetical protein ACC628_26110, partial [Pirellulaceae bacterium]
RLGLTRLRVVLVLGAYGFWGMTRTSIHRSMSGYLGWHAPVSRGWQNGPTDEGQEETLSVGMETMLNA